MMSASILDIVFGLGGLIASASVCVADAWRLPDKPFILTPTRRFNFEVAGQGEPLNG